MFQRSGIATTYLMHTHCLFNVVSGGEEKPEAALIRALEPVYGIELMKSRRGIEDLTKLTNGPGKLTKSLGIAMEDYGHPLTHDFGQNSRKEKNMIFYDTEDDFFGISVWDLNGYEEISEKISNPFVYHL
jgi:DNA-3-methyladenine glycosylase